MTRTSRVAAAIVVFVVSAHAARGARAFSFEIEAFHPRRGDVSHPPDAATLGLKDVSFPSDDGSVLRGWYIPSRTGAAVLLCHGTGADRSTMMRDARPLAAGGAGVLLFDMPGHGESGGGPVRFGDAERAAIRGAIAFLAAQRDVDPRRVGALGFSMGGYLLVQVASTDTTLRAVVLEGAFGDVTEQTRAEFSHAGIAARWGALLANRVGGMNVRALRPIDVVRAIAPRPIVLVAGTADSTVPLPLSRRLYDAAGAPKQFWVIAGAGHGRYTSVDSTYGTRLRTFFEASLPPGPVGAASSGRRRQHADSKPMTLVASSSPRRGDAWHR